jgi:siroheme synthase-like protein
MTLPVMLDGAKFTAVVVGGGGVATRKVKALLEGGARVEVIAPEIADELRSLALAEPGLTLRQRDYASRDARGGAIIIAATDDRALNRRIADEALAAGCLVNVVDDPDHGNFVTPAVHRSGDLTLAVSAGRAPAAAAAIRSMIAERFDGRYATAIHALRGLRDTLLGAGRREDWQRASSELIGEDFCAEVEQGRLEKRIASWR